MLLSLEYTYMVIVFVEYTIVYTTSSHNHLYIYGIYSFLSLSFFFNNHHLTQSCLAFHSNTS